MGVSTDAILFYGLCFDVEEENCYTPVTENELKGIDKDLFDESNWENVYRLRTGRTLDYNSPDHEWSWNWPVQIGYHCSDEVPMSYVAVNKSEILASRGNPQEVKGLLAPKLWDDQLREFCKVMQIEWQEPKWWLVSYWG